MKLYATGIPLALPSWATIISNKSGLIEVEKSMMKTLAFTQSLKNYLLKLNQKLLV